MTPRKTLRIARWETASGVGGMNRRTIALVAAGLVLVGVLVPLVVTGGQPADAGIYRVGVAESSPYYEPVAADATFVATEPDRSAFRAGSVDVLVADGDLLARDTPKGRAAAAALGDAVKRYNDRLMRDEPDRAAAFPVTVQLRYVEREADPIARATGVEDAGEGTGRSGGGGGGDSESGSGGGGGGSGSESGTATAGDAGSGGGGVGGFAAFGPRLLRTQGVTGTPSDIRPPFPFGSLILAFLFVVPMNFVIQAYASSVLAERTNRRGELLLVSPVSRWDIIAGKALPYLAAMLAIASATALVLGGGPLSISAVAPIALLFLSCSFVGALMARSHKELTFVLVTVSVVVTSYVFVPAIFSDIHPIASISPLTLVVRDLQGAAVSAGTYVFSTLPVYLASGVLFALGAGLYREEDLFAQLPLPAKGLDAMANYVRSRKSPALLSALSIPFVFIAELLAVAVLFVLPLSFGLPVLLGAIAAIEEVAKSVHVYAGFERARFDRSLSTAAVVGAASGAGFFVGEKFAAAAQLVGLTGLDLGRAAFSIGAGVGGASSPPVLAFLLLAPLVLHVVTAVLTAAGASRGRDWWVTSLWAAVLVHAAYNLAVVSALG